MATYCHGQKHKKNPTLVGSFKVTTKTQLNTKSPQRHNLNPTLTKTCIFHRADRPVGAQLRCSCVFLHHDDYNYGLRTKYIEDVSANIP